MSRATLLRSQSVSDSVGARAASSISPNTRVRGSAGLLATQVDALLFPGSPSVNGQWLLGDQRVRVAGLPSISLGASGLTTSPSIGSVGPMLVAEGDTRIGSS